jgi:hypothetical protein
MKNNAKKHKGIKNQEEQLKGTTRDTQEIWRA